MFLTFHVKRDSTEETTFATVTLLFVSTKVPTDDAIRRFRRGVRDWTKTPEGREAVEDSSDDFNVGDLAYCDLDHVSKFTDRYGVLIADITIHSVEHFTDEFHFDTHLHR